jgi:hypothetical protein
MERGWPRPGEHPLEAQPSQIRNVLIRDMEMGGFLKHFTTNPTTDSAELGRMEYCYAPVSILGLRCIFKAYQV